MKYKYVLISYYSYYTEVYHYKTLKELKKDLFDLYHIKFNQIQKYKNECNYYLEIIKIDSIMEV